MEAYTIEKISNMVLITKGDEVFQAWDESEVTKRKIENAKKKIRSFHREEIQFIDKLN